MTGALGLAAAVVVATAVALLGLDSGAGRRRLARTGLAAPMGRGAGRTGPPRTAPGGAPAATAVACGALGVALAVLLGGPIGVLVGALAGAVAWRWLGRLEPRALGRRRERLAAQTPEAADLLAACLASGAPLAQALAAVSEAVPAPAGDELARVVAQLRLGAGAAQAWAPLLAAESTAALARAVQRSSETGAPLAQALTRVADDLRARRRGELLAAARVAGVTAVLPLGLCFLPAFALLGVVPVVVSLVVEVVAL